MDQFTCRNFILGDGKTPKVIRLLGDKERCPEPAQHIIEFPGGAIELSRTSDGDYWAHIMVNRDYMVEDCDGLRRTFGEVVGARIDADNGVNPIPDHGRITQVAVRIRPSLKQT